MTALLQFGGLLVMGIFLLAGSNLVSHGGVYEFIGYMGIGFGVFGSSLLFYLGERIKVNSEENKKENEESIIYKNVNSIVDREIKKFKVKRLKVESDRT